VLSGCGRKSGLDLPPSASVADTPAAAQPAQAAQPAPDEWGPDNKPVAPIGTNKSTPLDWLID
jgi:predicted small lipoprotein YifL